jgi:hypothetical protein
MPFCGYVLSVLIRWKMAEVSAPDFKKLWSNQIACLRREDKDAIQQHSDAVGVMERVDVVLIDIARLAGGTSTSAGESPEC